MTTKYFAILTNQGAARLANATALGTKLNITQMAVGDGGGTLPTPDPAQTKLVNQTRIAPINSLGVAANDAGQIIAEQIIPENEGGFFIREIGLYDDDGVLIAVANCPETYKPLLAEGSGRTQTIRMILVVSSTSAITLKIDPSVVLATRKYVDDAVIEVKSYADKLMKDHEAKANPHKQYPLIENALKEMADAGLINKVLENLQLRELFTGVIGQAVNQKISLVSASASAIFTADQVIVGESLSGKQYRLNSVNKTINLITTGPGGMDTGAAPANGWVAIYVIYTPTTDTSALMAVNATNVIAPTVYAGANMPSGYSASALISIWRTTNGSLFQNGHQRGRKIIIPRVDVLYTSDNHSGYTPIGLSAAVPQNAIACSGYAFCNSGAGAGVATLVMASDSNGVGFLQTYAGTTGALGTDIYFEMQLPIVQEIYYQFSWTTSYVSTATIGISGYTI